MKILPMIADFIIIIFLGLLGGYVARRFKQPTIVGYFLCGFIGSFFLRNNFKSVETIDFISQIGVSFLLFTLGIELSFVRIASVYKIAVFGGIIQLFATTLIYKGALSFFGVSSFEAMLLAFCFSLSSTAVVVKILTEKAMTETLTGEILIGWLLVQDLAVVPMLLILPVIKGGFPGNILLSLFPVVSALFFLIFILFLGKKIAKKITRLAALTNSREILLLSATMICLLTALVSEKIGLSFALGAFLGGVIIAETVENHAILSEIRPLRDLFSVVFFVSLPLLIDPQMILSNISYSLLISVIVVIVKFLTVIAISLYFGYHSKISFMVAVGLVQVGEFAFILSREALRISLISQNSYSLILSVSILTILLTPFLFNLAPSLYIQIALFFKKYFPKFHLLLIQKFDFEKPLSELPFENHVVLCGYGRMGRYIGRALLFSKTPFVIVEINRAKGGTLRLQGLNVIYGDPSDLLILDYAQVDKARLLISAVPDFHAQERIITNAKTLNNNIKIIARTHFEDHQKIFKALGADIVIQPEFSAAIEAVKKIFKTSNLTDFEIEGKIARLKIEHGM